MNSKHSEGSAIAVIAILVIAVLAGVVLLVGAAGFFWYRLSYQRALQAEDMAARAMEEAKRQALRARAEAERAWRELDDDDSTAPVEGHEARLEDVRKRIDLTQSQLEEARRAWKEIIERTGGQLTEEDVADIDRELELLEVRHKELDDMFQAWSWDGGADDL